MKYIIKENFSALFLLFLLCSILIFRPLLANDLFEPDNTLEEASPIFVNDSIFQTHQFVSADDEDWMVFYVNAGTAAPYDIQIPDDSVDINANPVIEIYNTFGEMLLHHDFGFDGEGEYIGTWRAPAADFYYLRVYNKTDTESAVGSQYKIHLWEALAPFKSTIIGKVIDQCSGKDITGASVVVTGVAKTLTYITGDYGMPINPGDYTLLASAREYTAKSRSVKVEDRKRLIADFQLAPVDGCTELSAVYDAATGLVTVFDVLAYGVHYLVELQDQGGLLFKVTSVSPLTGEVLDSPALYDVEPLQLTIPSIQVSGQMYSVTLVNMGNFLFAVEAAQLIQ